MIKPGYQQPIDAVTLEATIVFFEKILKIIQPLTPFIAEEIWHLIRERESGADVIMAQWPEVETFNQEVLTSFSKMEDVITNIRNFRKQNNIDSKIKMELFI